MGVIILIFPAKVKGVREIFYKKVSGASRPMRRNAPNPAATRPRSAIETYSTFGILAKPGTAIYWGVVEGCFFDNNPGHSVIYKSPVWNSTILATAKGNIAADNN